MTQTPHERREGQRLWEAAYRERNRDAINARNRERRRKDKRHLEQQRLYRAANRSKIRAQENARHEAMRIEKAGRPRPDVCDVCGLPPGKHKLHWDHDHARGAFRGWLCHGCNVALGLVKDDPQRLRKLAAYLESGS